MFQKTKTKFKLVHDCILNRAGKIKVIHYGMFDALYSLAAVALKFLCNSGLMS